VMIAGTAPMPNQMISTGTIATLGIELKPISTGNSAPQPLDAATLQAAMSAMQAA